MGPSNNKLIIVLLTLLIMIVVIPLVVFLVLAQQKAHKSGGVPSWPVISRDLPAFASSGNASDANDDSYDTTWLSHGTPAWLAYDLSAVPASERGRVLLVWYNYSFDYDHTLIGSSSYDIPEDYTIDVNLAPGGGNPPETGWVTLVAVKRNHYHSRQHVINITGHNWIRLNVTATDGSTKNSSASIKMDVYDSNYATTDDWMFFGDSITAGTMGDRTIGGVKSFAQLINARLPKHFPVQEVGGISYLTSAAGANYIDTWLHLFPGKYVGLSYGTNDASGCASPTKFYHNYIIMTQAVLTAGKIPIIPHIPWGGTTNIKKCGPALNAEIDALYMAFPQIIRGPDLWAFFQSNSQLILNDNVHLTEAGIGAYRQQWANTMLGEVYTKM